VKKFNRVGETRAPDGTVLTLFEHDGDYTIRVNGIELMSTRRHRSEERLAEVVCEPLRNSPAPRVLVGGLGLGFTARAALSILPGDARVVVAELLPDVVAWNRNPEYPLAHDVLADPRLDLRVADVSAVLGNEPNGFDAIMLDVDNGAGAMILRTNERLYDDAGIEIASAALRPGGRLAYWSVEADPRFVRALRRAELEVEVIEERVYPTSKRNHFIFVATRRAPSARAPKPSRRGEA
jgi:spermidine synthase